VIAPALAALLVVWTGLLARYDLAGQPADRWELPHDLDEISGLAVDPRGRLLAHGDERAIIYTLDPAGHRVLAELDLGHPAARGDFEAIAVVDDRVVLTTSDGVLYAAPLGQARGAVDFVTYDTGVGRHCEVEGLAWWAADRTLLLSCKTPRDRLTDGYLTVFAWSLDRRALLPAPVLRVPLRLLAGPSGERHFHASELLRDASTGHYLVLAGQEHALAELTSDGKVVSVVRLPRSLHRQPEGLAIAPNGALLVGDEAAGRRATLSVYSRAR
jgi:uncharacterized protein YjiK